MKTNEKLWWTISLMVSAALIVVLIMLWSSMNRYDVRNTAQLVDAQAVDTYLKDHWIRTSRAQANSDPLRTLKTGIFIQSIKFFNSTEVNLTGYIWQRYVAVVHDDIKPKEGEAGFIFPEQVDSGSNIEPREAYRHRNGDHEEVIGWYFEATLRQPFEYSDYPFDHKTVWVRIWPKDFSRNIILVPDYDAYKATDTPDIFGIEESIVLGAWEREDTYFDYKPSSYDTNFGIDNYIGQDQFPELYYNVVIKRKFENAFVVHLLPLFLVAALLFATLLTVSGQHDIAEKHGFNTSGMIGVCSALFFVVLLAHIQLREQFGGSGVVYIEYFFFLMYAVLVLAAANTYLFCTDSAPWLKFLHFQDNLVPKLFYWPLVLGGMVVLTLLVKNGR
ncbi:MAG: hypothetical protein PVG41_18660 [Desulfobacteraceae bacterium]